MYTEKNGILLQIKAKTRKNTEPRRSDTRTSRIFKNPFIYGKLRGNTE